MIIEIIDEIQFLSADQVRLLEDVLHLANKKIGNSDAVELDISIVTDESIQQLNKDYRGKNQVTDVLSFALTEVVNDLDFDIKVNQQTVFSQDIPIHLGDIIISVETARRQAEEYQHSLERELAFLAVHGFLHLNGYDHQTSEEEKEMFALQEEVLDEYGLFR